MSSKTETLSSMKLTPFLLNVNGLQNYTNPKLSHLQPTQIPPGYKVKCDRWRMEEALQLYVICHLIVFQ